MDDCSSELSPASLFIPHYFCAELKDPMGQFWANLSRPKVFLFVTTTSLIYKEEEHTWNMEKKLYKEKNILILCDS